MYVSALINIVIVRNYSCMVQVDVNGKSFYPDVDPENMDNDIAARPPKGKRKCRSTVLHRCGLV